MGKKKTAEPEIPEQVVQAFQDTQKKMEVIQGQLDKLVYRIHQEKKRKETAKLALRFLDTAEGQKNTTKYYMQVGKAFSMRPFEAVQSELKTTFEEVEKEMPKLLIAQAQFEIKKKEQYDNLQNIAQQAKAVKARW